ncbi:hypothetical protein SAMN04489712_103517 [Thermomonospora echinospora]|uniref:Uncharacterized protein n=1 Tax=Thermomonospora echinospora TaxID=1992 RepID=A0A1H5Y2G6_9ACTN|nr:hypothetical protein [Thermomonospora echinospora]SEG17985.1 hypothetical protein SAMN04489712_103517 [Thermomonospora echinospora]
MRNPPRPRIHRPGTVRALAVALAMLASVLLPAIVSPANALAFPTPRSFVSNLDLECFRTEAYTPPTGPILTTHLNPVLADLPREQIVLGPREQLCVPVAKNGVIPPQDVLGFIRYVDLSCYRTQGINVNRQLNLRHLNPVLTGLPPTNVVMTSPQQLCVPVIKNGVVPPDEVLRLVQYIDLKCYLIGPQAPLNRPLSLTQLNPVLTGLPVSNVNVTYNRQLCVPVQKGDQQIPPEVLNIVRWLDLVKYDLQAPALPVVPLTLTHINPMLAGLPKEQVTLNSPPQLAVPVAKNGVIPPD